MRWLDGKSLKQRRVTRAAQLTCKTQYLARLNAFRGPPARRKLLAVTEEQQDLNPPHGQGTMFVSKTELETCFFSRKIREIGKWQRAEAPGRQKTERQKQRGESLPATHYIL